MKDVNLINIDYELIQDMRQSGRREEADKLLEAWRKSKEEAKEQVKFEIRQQNNLIKRFKNNKVNN